MKPRSNSLDADGAAVQAVERENATEEGIPLPVKYSGVTGRVAGGLYRVVVKNKSTEQAVATLKVRRLHKSNTHRRTHSHIRILPGLHNCCWQRGSFCSSRLQVHLLLSPGEPHSRGRPCWRRGPERGL